MATKTSSWRATEEETERHEKTRRFTGYTDQGGDRAHSAPLISREPRLHGQNLTVQFRSLSQVFAA